VDEIDNILRKKALELAKTQLREVAQPQRKTLTDEEVIRIVRQITKGDKAGEIIDNTLELYKPYVLSLFRKIAELHLQGVIKELADYELYQMLLRAGLRVPIKTEVRIVRHGREYKLGGD